MADWIWVVAGIAASAAALVLLIAYICFRMAFYASEREKRANGEKIVAPGKVYEPFHEQMKVWVRECRAAPHEDVETPAPDSREVSA